MSGPDLIFLSYALGYAEVIGADHIFYRCQCPRLFGLSRLSPGVHPSVPGTGKPFDQGDSCRRQNHQIETPLLELSKKEIIQWGTRLGAPLDLTTSCYRGGEAACGTCDSCLLRLKGFAEAGLRDPIPYAGRDAV